MSLVEPVVGSSHPLWPFALRRTREAGAKRFPLQAGFAFPGSREGGWRALGAEPVSPCLRRGNFLPSAIYTQSFSRSEMGTCVQWSSLPNC